MPTTYARVVRRAAEILGGVDALAAQLGVPTDDVVQWVQGTKSVPTSVFLKAVDIVTRDSAKKV
jgi:DNA-binding transcriptional regulator YdaS (Cro superfamily)